MKITITKFRLVLMSIITLLINFCTSAQTSETITSSKTASNFVFSKGADVSWLPQMEATGYKFYDSDGTPKDGLQLLKDRGINTIRLRVFVNPSNDKTNGHCSPAETVAMAVRAKNMGMRIMIDFHYSDTWADPAHQTKPTAWANHTFEELKNDVFTHTYDVLNALKVAGVTPEWVQIGNEIAGGMLWPEGSSSNFSQLAQLLNKGYDATKAVDATIKVILHLDDGSNTAKFRWFFDNATTNNVKYDVIGMSYYPYWVGSDYTATIGALQYNLNDMVSRYGKEVMVVEVGGDFTLVQNTYDMLVAVIVVVKSVPNNKGLGVIYWEPEGEKSWSGYQLNAWQANGKPSAALNAFKDDFVADFEQVTVNGFAANPVEQGKNVTVNLTYTANTATDFFYVGLVKRSSSGGWIEPIVENVANPFLVPSIGTNISSQVALTIPLATVPTASLANGEYYDIQIELWSANWGTRLWTNVSSKLTIVASGSLGVDDKNLDNELVMYPNPVSNVLNFKNSNGVEINSLKITNILGETVYSEACAEGKTSIDVSDLCSGIYILSIFAENGTQQFKFIKK